MQARFSSRPAHGLVDFVEFTSCALSRGPAALGSLSPRPGSMFATTALTSVVAFFPWRRLTLWECQVLCRQGSRGAFGTHGGPPAETLPQHPQAELHGLPGPDPRSPGNTSLGLATSALTQGGGRSQLRHPEEGWTLPPLDKIVSCPQTLSVLKFDCHV